MNAWKLIITGTTTLEVSFGLDEKILNQKLKELAEYEAFRDRRHIDCELERRRRAPILYKKWYTILENQLKSALSGETTVETHISAAVISKALYLLIISSNDLKVWVDKNNDLFSRKQNGSISMYDFIQEVGRKFRNKLASQLESISVRRMSWTITRAPQ